MMAVKQSGGHIAFLNSTETIVETNPQTTLSAFLNQRKRWTSKTKSYTDWQTIVVALVVFMVALSFLILFMGGFWQNTLFYSLLIAFMAKWIVDTAFLSCFLPFLNQKQLILHTLSLSVIYPVYIGFSAVAGLLGKFSWKQN